MINENIIESLNGQLQGWLAPFAHVQSLTFHTVENINQIHLDRLTDIVEESVDQIRDLFFLNNNPATPDLVATHIDRWSSVSEFLNSDINSISKISTSYLDELQQIATKNIDDIQRLASCLNPFMSCFGFDNNYEAMAS